MGGRAQFEFDETGNTSLYVIAAYYALILIPLTFCLFPREREAGMSF